MKDKKPRCYERSLLPGKAKVYVEIYTNKLLSEEEIKSREEYLKNLINLSKEIDPPFPLNLCDDELTWYLLDNVGHIVASEIHGLTAWDGETKTWYITTDVDPKTIAITERRNHITKISDSSFEGVILDNCF